MPDTAPRTARPDDGLRTVVEDLGRLAAVIPVEPLVGVIRGVGADMTEADDAFLQIVGYTRDDFKLRRLNWRDMTPAEFIQADDQGIQRAATTGGFTLPYHKEYVRKDGTRVPVLVCMAYNRATPRRWIGYVVDLSAPGAIRSDTELASPTLTEPRPQDFQRRFISELVAERSRLLAVVNNTDALMWAVDPELRLLSANTAFQAAHVALSGRELHVGESVLATLFPAERRVPWRAWYDRALAGEKYHAISVDPERGVRYDNTFSPLIDERIGVFGVAVSSQAIGPQAIASPSNSSATIPSSAMTSQATTSRAMTPQATPSPIVVVAQETGPRGSDARSRTLLDAMPLGVFHTDLTGACAYANPRVCAIWQFASDEMVGRGYENRIHKDDVARVTSQWKTSMAAGLEFETDYRLAFPGRRDRLVHVRVAPVHEKKVLTGFVALVDDVTERQALAHRARQSEKMESLGTLAGGIAHDFNNMLAVVLGYTDLALADSGGLGSVRDDLSAIRSASMRARDLVRQILTFSRRTEGEYTSVDMNALINESVRFLRATLPADIMLTTTLPDELVIVHGDATALQQVIVNLGTNAEYAMRGVSDGRLTIALECSEVDNGSAALIVRDTGRGMAPEERDRLFEPFFTTKPVGEGTGMGLAVVHGIIAAHNGTIHVDSVPKVGTTFTIHLPLSRELARGTPRVEPEIRGTGTVLIIEDEPSLLRFSQLALERAGYDVIACRDGAEALNVLHKRSLMLDLVISDVAMPHVTGDVVARQVRLLRPNLPVVLMTGFSHVITPENAHLFGARALLQKPFGAQELVAAVFNVLGR